MAAQATPYFVFTLNLSGAATCSGAIMTEELSATLRNFGENPDDYNTWIHPTGLSRWGYMNIVLNDADFKTLTASGTISQSFGVDMGQYNAQGNGQLNLQNCYAVASYPIGPAGGIYRVTIADKRYPMQFNISNRQLNYPVLSSSTPAYIASTATSGTVGYTLPQILTKLFNDITWPASVTAPSLPTTSSTLASDVPAAICLQNAPTTRAIDALLYTYGLVVLYDPQADKFTIDYIGGPQGNASQTALVSWAAKLNNWNAPSATISATGAPPVPPPATPQTIQPILMPIASPQNAMVIYPQLPVQSEGSDLMYEAANGTNTPAGASGGYIPLNGTNFNWGTGTPNTPNNPNDIAGGYFSRFSNPTRLIVQAFMMPPMSGGIDFIIWRQSSRFFDTTVEFFARCDSGYRPEWATLTPWNAASYHNCISRVDPFGRQQIFVTPATFPVLLNKDGGSDGSATAVITDTYSVYRNLNAVIGTDTPDGTTLSPSYNRAVFNMTTAVASSNGVVITAAASGSIGEGYIDKNGNIALYSAPEAISWGC